MSGLFCCNIAWLCGAFHFLLSIMMSNNRKKKSVRACAEIRDVKKIDIKEKKKSVKAVTGNKRCKKSLWKEREI